MPLVVMLVSNSYSPSIFVQGKPVSWAHIDCDIENEFLELVKCCWEDDLGDDNVLTTGFVCQTCTEDGRICGPIEPRDLEQLPTPQPFDPTAPLQEGGLEHPPTFSPFNPTAPLQGGVLEQQEQTPPPSAPGASPGILEQLEQDSSPELGFSERQQEPPAGQGAAELTPPTAEETQPAIAEEEPSTPVCQEGLEFNEDLGFCVPEDCPEGQVLDEESGICVLEEPETAEGPEEQVEPEEIEQQQTEEEDGTSEDNSN
jgi:hypothetical protein